MDLTPEQKRALATRLKQELLARFDGVTKRAYAAAEVNPETWKNAVEGQSMKPHSIIKIVKNLWPETGGDVSLIPPFEGASVGRLQRLLVKLADNTTVELDDSERALISQAAMAARPVTKEVAGKRDEKASG